jgi:hypothetical protein
MQLALVTDVTQGTGNRSITIWGDANITITNGNFRGVGISRGPPSIFEDKYQVR